jgi:hypothetical protein
MAKSKIKKIEDEPKHDVKDVKELKTRCRCGFQLGPPHYSNVSKKYYCPNCGIYFEGGSWDGRYQGRT